MSNNFSSPYGASSAQQSSNSCLFSNAATNSLIESLYKSVENNSSLSCNLPVYENSFFNPEQLIKFATGLDEKENKEFEFFGSISKSSNMFDLNNPETEKQIRNNLNSIINDSKETDSKFYFSLL